MSTNANARHRWASSYNQALGNGTLDFTALDLQDLDEVDGYNDPGWLWRLRRAVPAALYVFTMLTLFGIAIALEANKQCNGAPTEFTPESISSMLKAMLLMAAVFTVCWSVW